MHVVSLANVHALKYLKISSKDVDSTVFTLAPTLDSLRVYLVINKQEDKSTREHSMWLWCDLICLLL